MKPHFAIKHLEIKLAKSVYSSRKCGEKFSLDFVIRTSWNGRVLCCHCFFCHLLLPSLLHIFCFLSLSYILMLLFVKREHKTQKNHDELY